MTLPSTVEVKKTGIQYILAIGEKECPKDPKAKCYLSEAELAGLFRALAPYRRYVDWTYVPPFVIAVQLNAFHNGRMDTDKSMWFAAAFATREEADVFAKWCRDVFRSQLYSAAQAAHRTTVSVAALHDHVPEEQYTAQQLRIGTVQDKQVDLLCFLTRRFRAETPDCFFQNLGDLSLPLHDRLRDTERGLPEEHVYTLLGAVVSEIKDKEPTNGN